MSDLLYKIAVTKIPTVGVITARQIIAWCGGYKEVFQATRQQLLKIPGIGTSTVNLILDTAPIFAEAEEELAFIQKNDIRTYFYLDKDYPRRLSHYPDAPLLLYYKGNADLNHHRIVGIVGTRKPSERGRVICEEIVEGLKDYDVLIISGLAYGIDVTAHKKALELGIPTIGCLGHGLHMVYPSQHRKVAADMVNCGGLLTEFTSKQKPDAPHFPMRNRVIAGMSDALIVVETARRGGSMISAEIANSYNKDVFAVPGRVKDSHSLGCNLLIKSHRANLLESAEDIAYIMRWEKNNKEKHVQCRLFVDLNEQESTVVEWLRNKESEDIDTLSYHTGYSQSELASLLLGLEFNGVVKSLPGKRYMLLK